MTYHDILSLIKSEQARQGTSNRKLASMAGITPGAMGRILSGEIKAPSIDVVLSICDALKISMKISPEHYQPIT